MKIKRRILKRTLSITLCSLLLLISNSFATLQDKPPQKDTTLNLEYKYSDYANYFSHNLFPKIKKYISPYKRKFNAEQDSQKICEEVYDIIVTSLREKNIPIFIPPSVKLFELSSNRYVTYTLEVKIVVLDNEETIKGIYITGCLFEKRFLIIFKDLATMEV